MPGNLFLVGPMGAGKTAIGRMLARRLRRPFHDSDTEIRRRTGVDIGFIFDKEGEAGFRKRECEMLAELSCLQGIVLATGGGIVLDPGNRALLRDNGKVIYLRTSVDQQLERVQLRDNRPLLADADPRARLAELARERNPLYEEIADLTVDTDASRVQEVTRRILAHLE